VADSAKRIDACARTVPNAAGSPNLDAFHLEPALGLYLVVDGALVRASTDTVQRAFVASVNVSLAVDRAETALVTAVRAAQEALLAVTRSAPVQLVALLVHDGRARVVSIGACRCWLARGRAAEPVTEDDAFEVVEFARALDPEPLDLHPLVLGSPRPRTCARELELEPGDVLLLSSDALGWADHDHVRVRRVLEDADGRPLDEVLDRLLPADEACDDDRTAVLLRVGG